MKEVNCKLVKMGNFRINLYNKLISRVGSKRDFVDLFLSHVVVAINILILPSIRSVSTSKKSLGYFYHLITSACQMVVTSSDEQTIKISLELSKRAFTLIGKSS